MGLMMHLRNGEDATTLMIDCMGDNSPLYMYQTRNVCGPCEQQLDRTGR